MVKVCCVTGCGSSSAAKDKLKFFKFPQTRLLKSRWLKAIETNEQVTAESVICSVHFLKTDYKVVNREEVLKDRAVPSVFKNEYENPRSPSIDDSMEAGGASSLNDNKQLEINLKKCNNKLIGNNFEVMLNNGHDADEDRCNIKESTKTDPTSNIENPVCPNGDITEKIEDNVGETRNILPTEDNTFHNDKLNYCTKDPLLYIDTKVHKNELHLKSSCPNRDLENNTEEKSSQSSLHRLENNLDLDKSECPINYIENVLNSKVGAEERNRTKELICDPLKKDMHDINEQQINDGYTKSKQVKSELKLKNSAKLKEISDQKQELSGSNDITKAQKLTQYSKVSDDKQELSDLKDRTKSEEMPNSNDKSDPETSIKSKELLNLTEKLHSKQELLASKDEEITVSQDLVNAKKESHPKEELSNSKEIIETLELTKSREESDSKQDLSDYKEITELQQIPTSKEESHLKQEESYSKEITDLGRESTTIKEITMSVDLLKNSVRSSVESVQCLDEDTLSQGVVSIADSCNIDPEPVFIEIPDEPILTSPERIDSPSDCMMIVENVQVDIDPHSLLLMQPDNDYDDDDDEVQLIEKTDDPVSLLTSSDESDVIIEEPKIDTVEVSDETDEDDMPLTKLVKKRRSKVQPKKTVKNTSWGPKQYFCFPCKYVTSNKTSYNNHMKYHTKALHICTICQYQTASKNCFLTHQRKHKEEKLFQCHLCDYRAKHQMSLVYHMKSHSEAEKHKYKCKNCRFKSSNRDKMHQHLKSCRAEKTYLCDACDYSTKRKHDLTKHQKRKHSGIKFTSLDDEYIPGSDV